MKGLHLDDFVIGETITLGTSLFTRDAILAFARSWDPQPFHIDDVAARQSPFGALCASGWHTAAEWMRCYVDFHDRVRRQLAERGVPAPEPGPSPGFNDLRWPRPVYVNDAVTFSMLPTATRSLRSRPGWAMLISDNRGINQAGLCVLSFSGKVMVRLRD
jgi:acyl dehydratase